MNDFKHAKEAYDATPIPAELSERVQAGIREGRARYRARRGRAARRWMAAEVPVLGGLFRVLTFADYDKSEGGIHYDVSVPQVEAEGGLAQRVNAAIQEKVDAHLARARQDWADYQEAFFATGGTEEEWGGREMDVFVDYEIKSQSETRVSFVVTLAEGWVTSMEEQYYYNLDLSEDRDLTLRDLLGEDWVDVCNAAIREKIGESVDEEGFTFFFTPEDGGFTTVDETTGFYVRDDGTVVVCFPRYSIAAGAAGIPEFPII